MTVIKTGVRGEEQEGEVLQMDNKFLKESKMRNEQSPRGNTTCESEIMFITAELKSVGEETSSLERDEVNQNQENELKYNYLLSMNKR